MPGFDTGELASLRTEVEGWFDQLLDVYRGSAPANDSYGGRGAGTPASVHTAIPCEIYSGAGHVVDLPDAGQLVNAQFYTVTVAVGTDIQKGDKVVITSAGNLELLVAVVLDPQSDELQMQFIANREVLNG